MNKDIREIIDVAKKAIDIGHMAEDLGFSSTYTSGLQVFDEDVFKKLVIGSKQEPGLQIRDGEYKYRYRIKVDGIRFLYIADEPLFFEGIDLVEVKNENS